MKIAFTTSFFGASFGGQETSTESLFNELTRAGHNVYVIATRKSGYSSNDVVTSDHLTLIPKKLLVPGTLVTDHILATYIAEKLWEIKPDIIHIQDQFILPASVLANRKSRLPCIYGCHNNVLVYSRKSESARERAVSIIFRMRNRTCVKCLANVDAVITVSEYMKKELISLGVDSRKIHTIYNIPPCSNIKNIQLTVPTWKKKSETAETVLFAAGRLVWYKGFDVVLRAMKLVLEKQPRVKLIIAGDGPEMLNLRELVRACRLEPFVVFTGWVSQGEIMKLCKSSDVVMLPSVYPEAFGRGSIEAMSVGKPVIASDIGGIPETIIHGVNGLLVPPNNPEKTAEAILELVGNRHLRESMGKAGRDVLEKEFKPDELVRKTVELYEKIVCDCRFTRIC